MLLVRALLFVWEMFSRVGSFINSFPHWLSDSLTQWLTDIALEFTYPMRHGKDWRMLKCRWSDAPSNWSAPIGNFLSLNLSLEVYFFYIWLSLSLPLSLEMNQFDHMGKYDLDVASVVVIHKIIDDDLYLTKLESCRVAPRSGTWGRLRSWRRSWRRNAASRWNGIQG